MKPAGSEHRCEDQALTPRAARVSCVCLTWCPPDPYTLLSALLLWFWSLIALDAVALRTCSCSTSRRGEERRERGETGLCERVERDEARRGWMRRRRVRVVYASAASDVKRCVSDARLEAASKRGQCECGCEGHSGQAQDSTRGQRSAAQWSERNAAHLTRKHSGHATRGRQTGAGEKEWFRVSRSTVRAVSRRRAGSIARRRVVQWFKAV